MASPVASNPPPAIEGFIYVCPSSSICDGQMHSMGGLCIGRLGGRAFAIDDQCCHSDASLSKGDMEDLCGAFHSTTAPRTAASAAAGAGVCVRCPKHRRKFGGGLYFSTTTGYAFTKEAAWASFDACWRAGVWEVREVEGCLYRSLQPTNAVPKRPPKQMKRRPADHAPWAVASRQDISKDSFIMQLQRSGASAGGGVMSLLSGMRSLMRNTAPHPPCWHVDIGVESGSRYISRPYTPLSTAEEFEKGQLLLLVKVYPTGAFTPLLAAKAKGDTVFCSPVQPTLSLPSDTPCLTAAFGGTGFAPIYQLARSFLVSGRRVQLLAFNHTTEDYLGKQQIDALQADFPQLLSCTAFFTSGTPENRISADKAVKHAPAGPGTAAVVCGPLGMLEASRIALLRAGYHNTDIHLLDA